MGTSLTNIQVYVGEKNPQQMCVVVREAITKHLLDAYEVVDSGDLADRIILVLPSSARWISVYDQDSELQEIRILRQLTRFLSKQLKLYSFSLMVHDSDVLWMDLFSLGKKVDSYCSNGNKSHDEGMGISEKHENGSPDKWLTLLLNGKLTKTLKKVWTRKYTFVDDMLLELAGLFGIDGNNLCMGYNILEAMDQTPLLEKLYFRSRKVAAPKPPDFQFKFDGVELVRSVLPKENITYSAKFKNKGIAGKGVGVMLLGDRGELQHVQPNGCWVGPADNILQDKMRSRSNPTEFIETIYEDRPAWIAKFPNIEFAEDPKGLDVNLNAIAVEFHANTVGNDDLLIRVFPLENQDRGYSQLNIGIRVCTEDIY